LILNLIIHGDSDATVPF